MSTALPELRNFVLAPVSAATDVDAAMAAAEPGFEVWRDATPGERQRAMLRIAGWQRGGAQAVRKRPGYGADLSMYGFEEYTRIKHVMSYLG